MPILSKDTSAEVSAGSCGSTRMDTIEKTSARAHLSRSWSESSGATRKWALSYQNVRKHGPPESVEAQFERYRAWYLARSPEEELHYLNSTILRIQKWLRKKQAELKAVLNGYDDQDILKRTDIQRIFTEAVDQQEVIDLVVDRGHLYLHQHPNIVLEVDLDNLVYLWKAYLNKVKQEHTNASPLVQGVQNTSVVPESESTESRLQKDKLSSLLGDAGSGSSPNRITSIFQKFLEELQNGSRTQHLKAKGSFAEGTENSAPLLGCVRGHANHEIKLASGSPLSEPISKFRSSNQNTAMDPVKEVELAKGGNFEIRIISPENGQEGCLDAFAELDLPTEPKRRKMNVDTPSSLSSRSASPSTYEWWDDSRSSTPGGSPAPRSLLEFNRKYRKDELWKAIESHYQYLMDKEIINTCKSTESDLSLDDDDFAGNPNVSFAEFLQQYRELTEWLNQIQLVTKRSYMCLSEKYLHETYHEEMLERSPRRKFFNEYAKQLLLRYPHMKDEISTRMSFLNNQWQEVEVAIAPKLGFHDKQTMIKDLACDMTCLRKWLTEVEKNLLSLYIHDDWSKEQVQEMLKEHQVLQRDIESQSKVVSAVVKLSQRVYNEENIQGDLEADDTRTPISPQSATGLERRWHGVWLQSLEWQCRLEEALITPKGVHGHNRGRFRLSSLEESYGSENGSTQDVSSILGDSEDESLQFLGVSPVRLHDTPQRLDIDRHLPFKQSQLDKSSGDSANISEAESRMEDSMASPSSVELPVSQSSDAESDLARRCITKHENKDVGYSSESHSNDEIELMRLQSLMEDKYPGKCEVASDSPFLSDACTPRGRLKKDYYRMVSVDVDTTDKTDNDDTTDPSKHGSEASTSVGDMLESSKRVYMESAELCSKPLEAFGYHQLTYLQQSRSTSDQSEVEPNMEPQDKIRYLIDKAEDLVRSAPKGHMRTSTPKTQEKKTLEVQTRSVGCNTVAISSCDASAEDTDNESSAEEFSTATDDASEKQFDSVICLDYACDTATSLESVSVPPMLPGVFDNVRLRKKPTGNRRLKDRPWSVVEMQEFTRNLESQPFSTSESAIDRISSGKTDVPCSPPPSFLSPRQAATFPRDKKAGREMRRSFSTSDQSCSPRGAKRKLWYSAHNDTLQTSQAALTSSILAPSTDSEDDLTAKHISETDDMVDKFELARVRSSGSSADSDTDTSEAYMTPPVEPVTSDNDDVLNSTGSFSENAWDNYQSPLYPAVSDDPTEEKLHWEPSDEMEFDDEFTLLGAPMKNSAVAAAIADKKKTKAKNTTPSPAQFEDSDSDIDDFHYVLDQSADQLRVADHSLRKKRKDPMGTGIYLKPAKYSEIMATCVTNIRCLENISQHLPSADVAVDDYQRMQEILYEWEKLRALASERQTQSTLLSTVYKTMNEMKKNHEEIEAMMHTEKFGSAQDLETAINTLKEHQNSLQRQKAEVSELEKQMDVFGEQYSAIPISKFYKELADIEVANVELQHNLQQHVLKQEHTLSMWYEYLESCREMELLLSQDRSRLQKLICQRENGIMISRKELANEVETLQSSLSVYESKLSHLQSLRRELHGSSDEDTQTELLASLGDIRNQLLVYEQTCHRIQRNMNDDEDEEMAIEASQLGKLAVSAATIHEKISRSRKTSRSEVEIAEVDVKKATGVSRWLSSCPVQVAAIMLLAGLVYLFDPSIIQDLANLSIRISPELRYVNGPPPV